MATQNSKPYLLAALKKKRLSSQKPGRSISPPRKSSTCRWLPFQTLAQMGAACNQRWKSPGFFPTAHHDSWYVLDDQIRYVQKTWIRYLQLERNSNHQSVVFQFSMTSRDVFEVPNFSPKFPEFSAERRRFFVAQHSFQLSLLHLGGGVVPASGEH